MTAKVRILQDGTKRTILLCTAMDEDESSPVTKFDLDATSHTATKAAGSVAAASIPNKTLSKVGIEKVLWSLNGYEEVSVLWDDASTDEQALRLSPGEGCMEFANTLYPDTTPDVGDILFQTDAAAGGTDESYTIEIWLRKVWT